MRKVIAAVLFLALGAIIGVIGWEYLRLTGGQELFILLPARDGLEPGDPVYWREFQIGRVEAVALDHDRVRVTARIQPEQAKALSSDMTFKVETSGLINRERRLVAYVLDPEAPPLQEGATVEGVGSSLELALRRAAHGASRLLDGAARSEWGKEAGEQFDRLREELDKTDWDALGADVERSVEGISADLDKLAGETEREARDAYRDLKPRLEVILDRIERLGKSEEARRLRERVEGIWRGGEGAPAPGATPTP